MRILFFLIFVSICNAIWAQAPQTFSYQSVIRDGTGEIVANSPVSIRISILEGSAQGQVLYSENHYITTNEFGIVSLEIGGGNIGYGQFNTIPWGNGAFFIQTELDMTGGANFQLMGTNQLISVPYALYGRDEDHDTGNEIQTLQLSNDTLILSKGGGFIPINEINPIGEVKMFAVSMNGAVTISLLQSRGWAVCDGSTPMDQGIANAIINDSTPDLRNRFIRMSDNNTSGTEGGADTHNHQWAISKKDENFYSGEGSLGGWTKTGSGASPNTWYTESFDENGQQIRPTVVGTENGARLTGNYFTTDQESIPSYYELLFFIKVR